MVLHCGVGRRQTWKSLHHLMRAFCVCKKNIVLNSDKKVYLCEIKR
jgi:hypothetical protein